MARYTGPKTKICRKFGEPILGNGKYLDKNSVPPGQHGASRKRKAPSEYSIQLKEKQKAKYTYGLLERQFRIMFDHASRSKGITGEVLLQLCERRLDNVVYRLGIAPTRRAARQLVTHCHVTVNGEVLNIPSYSVTLNDVIAIRERSKSLEVVSNSLGSNRADQYPWMEWNSATMSGKMLSVPSRDMIPENIKEQLIVELYSK